MSLLFADGMRGARRDPAWVPDGITLADSTAARVVPAGTPNSTFFYLRVGQDGGAYRAFTPSAKVTAGGAVSILSNNTAPYDAGDGYLLQLTSGSPTPLLTVTWDFPTQRLQLRLGGRLGPVLANSVNTWNGYSWTYVEVVADLTAGTAELWHDGVMATAVTGQTFAAPTADRLRLSNYSDDVPSTQSATNFTAMWDDVYVTNNDGTAPVGRLGMPQILHLHPVALSGTLGTAYPSIDQPTDAGLVATANGGTATVSLGDMTLAAGTIVLNVKAQIIASLDSGVAGRWSYGPTLSGVDSLAFTPPLDGNITRYERDVTTKPGGGTWAGTDLSLATMKLVAEIS